MITTVTATSSTLTTATSTTTTATVTTTFVSTTTPGPVGVGVDLPLEMPAFTRVPAVREQAEWRQQIGLEVANLIGVDPRSVLTTRFNVATGLASIRLVGTREAGSTTTMVQTFDARKESFCALLLIENVRRSVCHVNAEPTAAPAAVLTAATAVPAASTAAAEGAAVESDSSAEAGWLSRTELIVLITFGFVAVVVVSMAISMRGGKAGGSSITNFTNAAFDGPPPHASGGSPTFAQGMLAASKPGPLYVGGGVGLSGRPAGIAAMHDLEGGHRLAGATIAKNWNNWGQLSASPQAPTAADLFGNTDRSLMSATPTTSVL